MLPPQLVSAYRQYKEDTDSVASWLASTARACGYPADLLTNPLSSAAQPKSARLKGKARREAAKRAIPTSQPQNKPKYTVATKDFIPLAEYIASRKGVTVPSAFSTVIDRVINLRSSVSKQISENAKEAPDEESKKRHSYFVGILERVREVLKPRMPAIVTGPTTSEAAGPVSLSNVFAALTVEEPTETEDTPTAPQPPVQLKVESDMIIEAEPQTSMEDAIVAYHMLVTDLNKIRAQVQFIWGNYSNGAFDAAAAAIATNSAIDLARNLIDEVLPVFKGKDMWEICTKFYHACCIFKGHRANDVYDFSPQDSSNPYATYDIANDLFVNAFKLIQGLQKVLQPGNLPLVKEGIFGTYNPSRDRKQMTGREKLSEDQVILTEYWTEIITLNMGVDNYPVQDEFVRGAGEVMKTGELPFYLVIAAQIHLDIQHILRADATKPFEHMMREMMLMKENMEKHLEFHKKLRVDTWSPQNDMVLRQLISQIDWIRKDPVYGVKAKVYAQIGASLAPSVLPNRILRTSPVLSGLMLYYFRAHVYDVGITVANAWGSIGYTWHLYNALEREHMLRGRWKDMDVVYSILGGSSFHVGEAPSNTMDYFKRFCLQMGVTASAFIPPDKRRGKTLHSRAGPRGFKEGCPVSTMFTDRYLNNSGQFDWSAEHLDAIVSRSKWTQDKDVSHVELVRDEAGAKAKPAKHPAGSVKPEDVVHSLAWALQAETIELAYPFLLMHRHCWELLRKVKASCDRRLRAKYTPAYMEKESELPWVIGYILMSASGLEGSKDMTLLQDAAEAVQGLINTAPDKVLRIFQDTLGCGFDFRDEADEEEEDE